MYLLINEDGSLQTAINLKDDVFSAADDGYVDIIDISGEVPFRYYKSSWHKIENVEY